MTTPDTSPGDELDEVLNTINWTKAGPSGYLDDKAGERRAEAKDRLNRLMLTRERERLEKLKEKQYFAEGYGYDHGQVVDVFDIDNEIAAIDAQLNKEETDGDVPTHSEPSKPYSLKLCPALGVWENKEKC